MMDGVFVLQGSKLTRSDKGTHLESRSSSLCTRQPGNLPPLGHLASTYTQWNCTYLRFGNDDNVLPQDTGGNLDLVNGTGPQSLEPGGLQLLEMPPGVSMALSKNLLCKTLNFTVWRVKCIYVNEYEFVLVLKIVYPQN